MRRERPVSLWFWVIAVILALIVVTGPHFRYKGLGVVDDQGPIYYG